ncbi:jg16533 [Pararge aegeria aegeria]|uniref:Jg16533 protein n=1 Tax=Pararge aegeria aegeria TaxID=348720 RepID=A0A8S4SRY9_9NEOP|nr:jg16533 [Pararge aegeria aegeria]
MGEKLKKCPVVALNNSSKILHKGAGGCTGYVQEKLNLQKNMDGFCRSCLVKFDEPTDLTPYSEKNRRLFVYATGLQAKRNDTFTFQLCKECYLNMKVACHFKKTSRNSDKKFKNYLANKESGDNIDFCTFLKNNDESFKFRLPMYAGNSTPATINKDDDNESTCTSIQNFMTDILKAEEIPDSEARIIQEVIEEEADVLEDSLDSHWLQDDVSVDTDFRLDFSFSPFSTPRSTNDNHCYTPKRINDPIEIREEENIPIKKEPNQPNYAIDNYNTDTFEDYKSNIIKNENVNGSEKCVIDVNLENALKNDTANKVMLDELLATPPVIPNMSAPPTPLIKNILFGEKLCIDTESGPKKVYMPRLNKDEIEDNLNTNKSEDICAPPTPLIKNILFGDKIDIDTESPQKKAYTQLLKEDEIDENMDTNISEDYESIKTKDKNVNTGEKCIIDFNLEKALKNDTSNKVMLDELLATPPVIPNISAPPTPLIKNILFGDKIDVHTEAQPPKNVYMPTDNQDEIDVLYEFFKTSDDENNIKEEYVEDYNDMYNITEDINEKTIENDINCSNRPDENKNKVCEIIKEPSSPIENKYCLKKLLCNICNRQFKLAMALKVHCKRIHKIQIERARTKRVYRKMVCDYCGKVFTSSKCIVKHIQNHMNPDQYYCDHCPLAFRTETGFKAHQTTHGIVYKRKEKKRKSFFFLGYRRHTGERPFECVYCPRKFARQDSLNMHMKCHTGERPFLCTFCDDKFISARHLKQHQTKCKTCLDKQMEILLETAELNNIDNVAVYYEEVTDNVEAAKNGPVLML